MTVGIPTTLTLALVLAVAAAAGAPSMHFESSTHDFGAVPSDVKQSFKWPYRNDGTGTLQIGSANPSCGCTATVVDPAVVPPGGTGTLLVTFDPAGQSGDVRKTITVTSNDPEHPHTILTILAKVIVHEAPLAPGEHPRIAGQSLLMGSCGGCHAAPAEGKTGAPLYTAICAPCHGTPRAPALDAAYLASHDDKAVTDAIAYGTASPKMPGFSKLMGGPLDDAQIASLVAHLRKIGK